MEGWKTNKCERRCIHSNSDDCQSAVQTLFPVFFFLSFSR
jgi:hypothetical protein